MVNRAYAASATSHGMGFNDPKVEVRGMPQKTMFTQLLEMGLDYRVYFQQFPSVLQHQDMRRPHLLSKYRQLHKFHKDVRKGDLPQFTWLEPGYFDGHGFSATDQHPDHDVSAGDKLIKDVFESIRASPLWEKTAFVITYDEHGGFFDHVPRLKVEISEVRNGLAKLLNFSPVKRNSGGEGADEGNDSPTPIKLLAKCMRNKRVLGIERKGDDDYVKPGRVLKVLLGEASSLYKGAEAPAERESTALLSRSESAVSSYSSYSSYSRMTGTSSVISSAGSAKATGGGVSRVGGKMGGGRMPSSIKPSSSRSNTFGGWASRGNSINVLKMKATL